jgi:enterochelin esterase-like enzyme
MKTSLFIFLPVLSILVTVVCACIFIACKSNQIKIAPYASPFGFDSKKDGNAYGTLTEKSYSSATTGAIRKCYVYTPPNYDPNVTYPIMYLLHGIGGTHTEWPDGGNPNEILSNLINSGEAKPMIVVMPNVRAMKPDTVPSDVYGIVIVNAFNNFINDLTNDLMPFIKKEYKVSSERTQCAIAGLSMGGMESLHIGIRRLETFGFIGTFSSAPGLPLTDEQMKLPDEYKNNTFIMICCGLQDDLLSFSQKYNQSLVDNGVKTTYYTLQGYHNFTVWKNGLYNFAKRIF